MSTTTQTVNLPSLPDWVQRSVRALYGAKSNEAFDTAFDAFVAPEARIHLNGRALSRADYKRAIRGETSGETGADVKFADVVSVPDPKFGDTYVSLGGRLRASGWGADCWMCAHCIDRSEPLGCSLPPNYSTASSSLGSTRLTPCTRP